MCSRWSWGYFPQRCCVVERVVVPIQLPADLGLSVRSRCGPAGSELVTVSPGCICISRVDAVTGAADLRLEASLHPLLRRALGIALEDVLLVPGPPWRSRRPWRLPRTLGRSRIPPLLDSRCAGSRRRAVAPRLLGVQAESVGGHAGAGRPLIRSLAPALVGSRPHRLLHLRRRTAPWLAGRPWAGYRRRTCWTWVRPGSVSVSWCSSAPCCRCTLAAGYCRNCRQHQDVALALIAHWRRWSVPRHLLCRWCLPRPCMAW